MRPTDHGSNWLTLWRKLRLSDRTMSGHVAGAQPVGRRFPRSHRAKAAPWSSAPGRSRVQNEDPLKVTTDPYDEGVEETRQDFTANDFRLTRALDSLLMSAKAITGDQVSADDIAARVHALRHLLKQVGHTV